jgi:hypothetical protein
MVYIKEAIETDIPKIAPTVPDTDPNAIVKTFAVYTFKDVASITLFNIVKNMFTCFVN